MDVPAVIPGHKAGPALGMTQRLWENYDSYLRFHRVEGSTEATIKFYRKELRLFLQDLPDDCQTLQDLTAIHVLDHLSNLKDRDSAPRTLRTRLQAIKTWLKWCVAWELLERSPATQIRSPKVPRTRKGFLAENQFEALLALCPLNTFLGARQQSMLWLLVTSGMRRREMWMLKRADLDWEKGVIRVIHGKGQKERQVPFDRTCQRAMLRYLHFRADPLDWLWVTEERERPGYDGIGQDLKRLADRAGVEVKDVCHVYRRTFAAHAVRQSIPRQFVQAIAGWSTPQMLDHYVAAMEAEEGAIEAFREFKPFGG